MKKLISILTMLLFTALAFAQDDQEALTDSAALRLSLDSAKEFKDNAKAALIAGKYLKAVENPFKPENLAVISTGLFSVKDPAFTFFVNNLMKIERLTGGRYEMKLVYLVWSERMRPLFEAGATIDYRNTLEGLKAEYPALGEKFENHFAQTFRGSVGLEAEKSGLLDDDRKVVELMRKKFPDYDVGRAILEAQLKTFDREAKYTKAEEKAVELLKRYGKELPDASVNDIVWNYLVERGQHLEALNEGVKWMKILIDKNPYWMYLDTYANALYKSGNKNEGIAIQKAALAKLLSDPSASGNASYLKALKGHLVKMENNEKTW